MFYGRALSDNRPVGIKRLHAHFLHQKSVVARFEHEAALVLDRGLVDPNIVKILDRGHDAQGVPFLVMEWVEGWTVSDLLAREGRLSTGQAAGIVCQALSGLAAAHARGVVHRDIKPANLMVTREGRVMVMDLGIAKEVGPEITAMTGLSGVPATLAYAAPEQLAGEPELDGRTDVFAMGATLYYMLSGTPAFSGPARDVLPPDLNGVREDVPVGLARVVRKALARDRAERFQTALEMAAALRAFAPSDDDQVAAAQAAESELVHVEPQPGKRRGLNWPGRLIAAGCALIVVMGVALGIQANGGVSRVSGVSVSDSTLSPTAEPSPPVASSEDVVPPAEAFEIMGTAEIAATPASAPPTPTATAAATSTSRPTILPTSTPGIDDRWTSTLAQLDPLWGKDWAGAIALITAFRATAPDYQPAQEKLYAALLFAAADQLDGDDVDSAVAFMVQAQSVDPDRPEARATLTALTPTPFPTPTPIPRPAPTARPPAQVVKPQAPPATATLVPLRR